MDSSLLFASLAMLLTMATTYPRTNSLVTRLSQWHINKRDASLSKRLGMRSLEVVGVATAMLILPALIHSAVQCLNDLYELLGRRARSPYTQVSWINIFLAVLLLVGAHVWLGRVTSLGSTSEHRAVVEDTKTNVQDGGPKKHVTWAEFLSRVVIPLILLVLRAQITYQVGKRLKNPNSLITKNTVDMQEAMAQLYGIE